MIIMRKGEEGGGGRKQYEMRRTYSRMGQNQNGEIKLQDGLFTQYHLILGKEKKKKKGNLCPQNTAHLFTTVLLTYTQSSVNSILCLHPPNL